MSIGLLAGREELAADRSIFKGHTIDKEEKPNPELKSCYTYYRKRFSYYTSRLYIVKLRPFLKVEILLTLGQFWP